MINGKVVALCQYTRGDNAGVFTLADKALSCCGHGKEYGGIENNVLVIIKGYREK